MLVGYSLSYNTSESVNTDHVEQLLKFMDSNAKEYIITHEHIDRVSEHKDHIQCFFTIDQETATPASVYLKYMTPRFTMSLKKPACLLKRHKGSLLFGFGYCMKEVPDTGRVLHTNLSTERYNQCNEFYQDNKENDTILVKHFETFFNWLKPIEMAHVSRPPLPGKYRCYRGIPVLTFQDRLSQFLSEHLDITLTANDYRICMYNFQGKQRGYLNLGFDSLKELE